MSSIEKMAYKEVGFRPSFKDKTIKWVNEPKGAIIFSFIFAIIHTLMFVIFHLYTGWFFAEVNQGAWQSFVNTAWQVHSAVLTISVAVVVFMFQAITSKKYKADMLAYFVRSCFLYPIVSYGLCGIALWTIVSAVATLENSFLVSAALLDSAMFASIVILLAIAYLYSKSIYAFDSGWVREYVSMCLKEANYLERASFAAANIFENFVLENKEIISTIATPDSNMRSVTSAEACRLKDINTTNLKLLLPNLKKVILKVQPNSRIGKGEIIAWIPNETTLEQENGFIQCFTFVRNNSIERDNLGEALDMIQEEVLRAVNEKSITGLKDNLEILLTSISFHYENRYPQSLAQKRIQNKLFQIIKYILASKDVEIYRESLKSVYFLFQIGFDNRSLNLVRIGLLSLQQFYKYTIRNVESQDIKMAVIDYCLRVPSELAIFRLKSIAQDSTRSEFFFELLRHYHIVFYESVFDKKLATLSSVFDSIEWIFKNVYNYNKLKIEGLSALYENSIYFYWMSWLFWKFERKEIDQTLFLDAFSYFQKKVPDLGYLSNAFELAFSSPDERSPFSLWQERDEYEKREIKIGIYSYTYPIDEIALRGYCALGLLLSGRQGQIHFLPSVRHLLERVPEIVKSLLTDKIILGMFPDDTIEIAAKKLLEYNDRIIRSHVEWEEDRIIKERFSQQRVIELQDNLNSAWPKKEQVSRLFKQFGVYTEIPWEEFTDTPLKCTLRLDKKLFLESYPKEIIGMDLIIEPLVDRVGNWFFERLIRDSVLINLNGSLEQTLDQMIVLEQLAGRNTDVIFVPWGMEVYKLLRNSVHYKMEHFDLWTQGAYKDIPIIWMPDAFKNMLVVTSIKHLGRFEQGVLLKSEKTAVQYFDLKILDQPNSTDRQALLSVIVELSCNIRINPWDKVIGHKVLLS